MLRVTIGELVFEARLEAAGAPKTCAALRKLLPLRAKLIQARWSGESAWVPLGDLEAGVGVENATSYPAPGELLLYPGGYSETEILVPYGPSMFASKLGQLAGNHFATIEASRDQLAEIGRRVIWQGAQDITLEEV